MKHAFRVAGVTVLLAATGWSLHRWALLPLECSRLATRGTAALHIAEKQSDYLRRRVAASVQSSLAGCACISPPNVQIHAALARAAAARGDDRAAIAEYRRALRIDRRPELYFGLAMAELRTADRAAAVDAFTRACAFDPARLAYIPYDDVREEIARRLRALEGPISLPYR